MSINPKELALNIAEILDDKKAVDIVILDIHDLTEIADYFVIASGRSELQVKSLYGELDKRMNDTEIKLLHQDGHRDGRWIALDYGSVIVHIFHHEERSFYNLERLWADGKRLVIDS